MLAGRLRRSRGFSLIELVIAAVIVALLASVAVPVYREQMLTARAKKAVADMGAIELAITEYRIQNGNKLPLSLDTIGMGDLRDPWGRRYVYLELTPRNERRGRKNRNLAPLNTDYDLYSSGRDGLSAGPITMEVSFDDVIRANNGAYFGLARDY